MLDGLILYKGHVYISPTSSLGLAILELVHGIGHEGVHKTLHRLRADFRFPKDRQLVQDFVRSCAVCQKNKSEHLQPGGLLQPLEVPTTVWSDVAMDFVEALPKVNVKTVILTVVGRFSKAAHFIALAHPYTAPSVARAFFSEIVRLHGIPSSEVSDRDPVFTSTFWQELFKLAGVKLRFTLLFILNQMVSPRLQTRSSQCICGASRGIGRRTGWNGCLGLSSATILHISNRSKLHRSGGLWASSSVHPIICSG